MILQRYVIGEFARAFGMIIAGLFIIYFSTRFASYLGQAAEGKIAPEHISQMLMLKMVIALKDLIPMSLYLGVFAAVIRLQRDLELTAMRAAGVGHVVLLQAAVKLSLVAALVVSFITLYAEPRAEAVLQDIRDQTENEATIAGVKAGQFKELSGGKRIFYAERISPDDKTLGNAFVQVNDGTDLGLLRSDAAYIETDPKSNDRFAMFRAGTTYAGRPGALNYVITEFDTYALRIENRSPTDVSNQVNFMATEDLLKFQIPGFRTEVNWRLATPIATLLLPLLALLIGMASTGANWYVGLLTSISMYFLYSNLLGVVKALIKRETLPPNIGLWLVHFALLATVLGVLFFQRHPHLLKRTARPSGPRG